MNWRAIVGDVLGLLGHGVFCSGVYRVAGLGWALITVGAPFCAIYFWHEVAVIRAAMRPRKP